MWVFLPVEEIKGSGTKCKKSVRFDAGFVLNGELRVVRTFDSRTEAENYVHYLNGGIPTSVERTLHSVHGIMLRAEQG